MEAALAAGYTAHQHYGNSKADAFAENGRAQHMPTAVQAQEAKESLRLVDLVQKHQLNTLNRMKRIFALQRTQRDFKGKRKKPVHEPVPVPKLRGRPNKSLPEDMKHEFVKDSGVTYCPKCAKYTSGAKSPWMREPCIPSWKTARWFQLGHQPVRLDHRWVCALCGCHSGQLQHRQCGHPPEVCDERAVRRADTVLGYTTSPPLKRRRSGRGEPEARR